MAPLLVMVLLCSACGEDSDPRNDQNDGNTSTSQERPSQPNDGGAPQAPSALDNRPVGLVASPAEHDFGRIRDQEPVTTTFKIRNVTEEDIEIETVRTSCACVRYEMSERRIKAGGEVDVQVTYDPRGRYAKDQKLVIFAPKNRNLKPMSVKVRVNIINDLTMDPRILSFGNNLRVGRDTIPQDLKIVSRVKDFRLTNWKVIEAGTNMEDSRWKVQHLGEEPGEDGGEPITVHKLKVAFSGSDEAGRIVRRLVIPTGLDHQKELACTLVVSVVGVIQVLPEAFYLGGQTTGSNFSVDLALRCFNGQPLKITGMSVEGAEDLGLKLGEPRSDPRRRGFVLIPVTGTVSKDPKNFNPRGALILKTDQAEQPVVRVPVIATVLRAPIGGKSDSGGR